MRMIALLITIICLSPSARAIDEATPSPTPVSFGHRARSGSLRRAQQISRRRAFEAEAESRTQARMQRQATLRTTAAAEAKAREAVRAREQAQREVAAQNRLEARKATPHPTSDLMKRLGFTEAEIAAQKAKEELPKPGTMEINVAASPAADQPAQAQPRRDLKPKAVKNHPSLSKASGATPQEPASISPAPDPLL